MLGPDHQQVLRVRVRRVCLGPDDLLVVDPVDGVGTAPSDTDDLNVGPQRLQNRYEFCVRILCLFEGRLSRRRLLEPWHGRVVPGQCILN